MNVVSLFHKQGTLPNFAIANLKKLFTMADIAYIPDGNGQVNNLLPWVIASQNGMYGNGFFGGGAGLGAFLGGAFGSVLPNLFGRNYGGWNDGNGNAAAASLGAQATANNNTDLIMQAINGTDADVRALAASNGNDFSAVRSDLNILQSALATIGAQIGMAPLQIVNAVESGDARLAAQLYEQCCNVKQLVTAQGYDNQLRTSEQTYTLGNAINGVQQAVAAKAAADQLALCQQTYALTDTMNRDFLALDNKIDALESSRKDREITALTAEVAKLESQNFTAGVIQQAVAPINAQLASIRSEVDDIKCKQPNTVSVPYPNLAAVNMTPYVSGGYYQGGFNGLYGSGAPGFGWGNSINF